MSVNHDLSAFYKCFLVKHCTTCMNTEAPWLSQRPEFGALVLLYRCCCCTQGWAIELLKSRGSKCGFVSPCPLSGILVPLLRLCGRFYIWGKWHAHAHTQMNRPWQSQKKKIYIYTISFVRLLLYRGCRKVESLRV